MNLIGLVPDFLKGAFGIIDKMVPDKDAAQQIKSQIAERADMLEGKLLDAQKSIIVAEAEGGSWLKQNWRPLTMLTFVALIVLHWLGYTAENLSEAQIVGLLDIVKIGLGGYVVGRSVEKTAKYWRTNG